MSSVPLAGSRAWEHQSCQARPSTAGRYLCTTCDLSVFASSHRSSQVFYTGTFGRARSLAWMGSPPFLTPQASTLLWRTCLQHPCSLQYGRATLRCWPPSASVANNLLVVLLPLALYWHCRAASLPAHYCCSVLWPLMSWCAGFSDAFYRCAMGYQTYARPAR